MKETPYFRVGRWLLVVALAGGLWLRWRTTPHWLPKPYGHPRIVLPAHDYVRLQGAGYPYSFEVSRHAAVVPDASDRAEPWWITIVYPALGAEIQLTYKPVGHDPQLLRTYCNDAYRLTAKHQVMAHAIREKTLKTPQGHTAVVAELYGPVPSQMQFHTSDTVNHFLRGALYFSTATQNDYLAPIIDFVKEDIVHLIRTLEWDKPAD